VRTVIARVRPSALALVALVLVLALVAWRAAHHVITRYDTEFHLAWGRDLVHGRLPGFDQTTAPTEHPLFIVVGMLSNLVPGVDPHLVIHAITYLEFGAVIVLVLLLGAELFSWAAGAVGAGVMVVNSPLLTDAAGAEKDLLSSVLVLLAVLLAVRRPRRAVPPLVLLGLAGLIRPEAWALAGVYWLSQLPRRTNCERLALGLLAAAAPAIWFGFDLLVTGDPLFSFSTTRDYLGPQKSGLGEGVSRLWLFLKLDLGRGALYGGLAGAVAVVLLPWRRGFVRETRQISGAVALPLATVAISSASFIALGAGKLPLYERFLFVPISLLAVFFGFAVTAAWHLAPRSLAAVAGVAGLTAAVSAAVYVPDQIDRTQALLPFLHLEYRATHGLDELVRTREAKNIVRRCPTVAVSPFGVRPYLANYLHREPPSIWTRFPPPQRLALFAPADQLVQDILYDIQRTPRRPMFGTPPGYRLVAATDDWRVLARGC
jgi:hypothetical protein